MLACHFSYIRSHAQMAFIPLRCGALVLFLNTKGAGRFPAPVFTRAISLGLRFDRDFNHAVHSSAEQFVGFDDVVQRKFVCDQWNEIEPPVEDEFD